MTSKFGRSSRPDLTILVVLFLASLAVRIAYVLVLDVPSFDPWRHLALIRNLREGEGFTLFAGQAYIWYGPLWYRLCALFPESVSPEWIAAVFSALAAPCVYLLARDLEREETRLPALVAGGLTAVAGPLVEFTCHYGQEGLALFLVLAALLLGKARRGVAFAAAAGIVFGIGVTLRMNFAFLVLLFLPFVRDRRRLIALGAGIVVPLAVTWFRNHQVISAHPFVFTWDGLATRSSDYNLLSTLVVQMHPAVVEGLSRLHEAIVPQPEWVRDREGYNWDLMAFMACGLACLVASRRVPLIAAGALTMGYFLFFDSSNSSHFFRIYLPLFPVFFLAVGEVVGRMRGSARGSVRAAAWGLVLVMPLAGARYFHPPEMLPLEMLVPPPSLLTEDAYLVNSAFYRPASLIYRFPDTRFVGLPLEPAQFSDFHTAFPAYRTILWHSFSSVQEDLARYLAGRSDFEVLPPLINAHGVQFELLRAK